MELKKISEKTGFTFLEIKVLLFLLIILVAGICIKYLFIDSGNGKIDIKYDYTYQDSLFLSSNGKKNSDKIDLKDSDKNVDYKQEVLDFRIPEFSNDAEKKELTENSINVNKIGEDSLTLLPGIGPKTADNIIKYRLKNGKFKSLNELLKVKGIGDSKFNKIKKYLYIEK